LALDLIRKIPLSMRNPVWSAFMSALEDEISLMREVIAEKQALYNTEEMDYDRMVELSGLLGVKFDASITDSEEFVRREIQAIPFKIKYKSTKLLYNSFFKSLDRIGFTYIYYFLNSSEGLVRNTKGLLDGIAEHDFISPWIHEPSDEDNGYTYSTLLLDEGRTLDDDPTWSLDSDTFRVSSNHIGLEFIVDRIITKNYRNSENVLLLDQEFLMTREYIDYIQKNVAFSRRLKEIPHIGAQLNCFCDSTKTVNPLTTEYSIPSIKLKSVLCDGYDSISGAADLAYVKFGIGSHTNLPTKEGGAGEALPTDLDSQVSSSEILVDERFEVDGTIGVIGEYVGQKISGFNLHDNTGYLLEDAYGSGTVDGVNTDFQGTLLFDPIKRKNVVITMTISGLETSLTDDGSGGLIGEYGEGTIDYETGQYSFSTDFNYEEKRVPFTGDGVTTIINASFVSLGPILTSETFEQGEPHVWLRYNCGNRIYIARDDGLGNIVDLSSDGKIISATVDYNTWEFSFEFSDPVTLGQNMELTFYWNKISQPDDGSAIVATYYYTAQSILITEAGIFNLDDELVAYATFPPVEFATSSSHLSMGFILSDTPFS